MSPEVHDARGAARIGAWARGYLGDGHRPTIDEFTRAALAEPELIDSEYQALAVERALRSDLRRVARSEHDGLPFALSVKRMVGGEARREYAALSFFDAHDYDDALAAARKRIGEHIGRYQALAKRANDDAGVQMVLPVIRWVSTTSAKAA